VVGRYKHESSHRTGPGPKRCSFPNGWRTTSPPKTPCASGRLRRVAGFARAGFCQGPMRGHGLSALRIRRHCSNCISTAICIDSVVAVVGGRMPSERGGDLAVGASWRRTSKPSPTSGRKPQAAAGSEPAVHGAVPEAETVGANCWPLDGSKFAAVNARDQNFNAAKLQDSSNGPTRGWPSISSNWTPAMPPNGRSTLTKTTGGQDLRHYRRSKTARRTAGAVAGRRRQAGVGDRPDTRKNAHGRTG